MNLTVAILAGGLATRLRPLTERMPKSLIPVAGKPFIHHQLRQLQTQGVQRVILCVAHLGEVIQSYVGDGSHFNIQIEYSFDGPTLLGTGGALRRALPLLGEAFFILYGDSFLPIEFEPIERAFWAGQKEGLLTIQRNHDERHQNNVIFRDNEVLAYDKTMGHAEMHYIDYGLSVLSRSVFEPYPSDTPFDLADVYFQLSSQRQLLGYEVKTRFYEIGSRSGIQETEDYILRAKYIRT